ncbi:site-specific integrase [Leisingera caerulea]|uniref:site-specific integrase n=1 Tax=Leisingera caerulea TaxID=506591 RepID=UPI00041BA271|nr:site-specific integrase [Leisingera caerulea]
MPTAKQQAKEQIEFPRYMAAYSRQNRVAFKYLRDVPKALQPLLGRKRWDLSLGSKFDQAKVKCEAYTKEHDRIIALLKDSESRSDVIRRGIEDFSAAKLRDDIEDYPDSFALSWRDTEEHLIGAAKLSPQYERESLAAFAWQAFGDRSHIDQIKEPSPVLKEALSLPVATPPDGGDTMSQALYAAMQTVLNDRLSELVGKSKESDAYRLSSLRERYFKLNNSSAATMRSYRGKIDAMTDKLGDLPLHQFTPEKLRLYRDHLLEEGLKPDSVAQYFAPVKAIMRWAISEELVPGFDAMPTDKVKMPRNDTPVEESRWQRFDDDEIKHVWGLVQEAWGPESKYTPERQEAFKWAFRVALYTAARPVEIFRMKPENVMPDFITMTTGDVKTRISRKLPLTKHLSGFFEFMQDGGWNLGKAKPESVAGTMSDSFTKSIRAAGFTNDRQVLYSTKDTLVDRLQRAGHSDDIIRGITGHVSGQGQLRNYKTRLNDTPEGLAMLRTALDAITYW